MADETIAAILAEMRADRCIPHHIDWADRIEAAAERELLKVSARKVSEMTACNFRPYADGTAALAAVERHLDSIENAAKGVYDAIVRDDWLMARSLSDEIRMSVSRAKSDANNLYMKDSRNAAPGNAAALREALDKALCVCLAAAMFKERGMPDDALCADFDGAIEACKSALSAPARNCDRFQNASVAAIAYRAENEISDEADFFASLANWLFAPTEGVAE